MGRMNENLDGWVQLLCFAILLLLCCPSVDDEDDEDDNSGDDDMCFPHEHTRLTCLR